MKRILFLILMLCFYSGMVHGDLTWTSPVAISTALTDASDPRVIVDSNGNATAAWVENNTIKASSLPFGGSWSAPVTLSNPLNTASTPKLGLDSSGNVTALWIENTMIESAILPFGGSWSVETLPISGLGASNPSLAVDASGNVVAVWVRGGFIESSTRTSGVWSLVSILSLINSSNPHVAISSFGTAIAVWHSVISGSDVLVTDILTLASNTWGVTKNIFSGTAAFFHNCPKIAIDANGNAAVAWFRYNFSGGAYQNVQLLVSSLTQGASAWTVPTILSNPGIRNPADLTVKLKYDVNGDALAVWTNSYDGQTFSTESSVKLFGGAWQGFITVQVPTIYSFGLDLTTASGAGLLTTMAWDGISTIAIQAQETDMTDPILQGWTNITSFSTGSNNGYPLCALSITGSTYNAVAVWIHFDGSNSVIHAITGSGSTVVPPASVSATQSMTSFGLYKDYFNTITWAASTDPDLIQYNIYRNGLLFAEVDSTTLTVIDHNQIQSGTVTYGIGALTTDFRQSPIITYTLFP